MKLTQNFDTGEANCRCGCGQARSAIGLTVLRETAKVMEKIRSVFGEPIHVNSWYRCPAHNQNVGGATHSLHLRGMAVDFTVKSKTAAQVADTLRAPANRVLFGGLGEYAGFVHVDTGETREWEGE